MNKGTIVCGIAAALLGGGLLWTAGSREETGISGWQTLNVSMEQAIGIFDPETQAEKTVQESAPANSGAEAGDTAAVETVVSTGQPATTGTSSPLATPAPPTPAAAQVGMINVNTAASAELMNLPGIGEKKAQAIIEYRNSKGAFHSLSDLGKVKGIGTKMLEKLKALVLF